MRNVMMPALTKETRKRVAMESLEAGRVVGDPGENRRHNNEHKEHVHDDLSFDQCLSHADSLFLVAPL